MSGQTGFEEARNTEKIKRTGLRLVLDHHHDFLLLNLSVCLIRHKAGTEPAAVFLVIKKK